MKRGDRRRALAVVKEREAVDPLSAETRGLRLEYLVRTRSPEAGGLSRQLWKEFPDSPGVLFWCGRAEFLVKNYKAAEELFRECFRTAPYPSAEHWLGKTLTNLGRCDEAEPILTKLSQRSTRVLSDLAWLYERKADYERALAAIRRYLEHYPRDMMAKEAEIRLKSRLVDRAELLDEVEVLADLGEEVPAEILPEVLEQLFVAGRVGEARDLVRARLGLLEHRHLVSIGWTAKHLGAFDLVYELFLAALPSNLQNVRLVKVLMLAARNTGRAGELAEVFDQLASRDPKFFGHIKTLKKWAENE